MVKIPLKTAFIVICLTIALQANYTIFAGGSGLNKGDVSPNPEFLYENFYDVTTKIRGTTTLYDYKEDKIMLVAFMPDITDKNKYADVMTSAFSTYFVRGMAFGESYQWNDYKDNLKVLIVTNNDQSVIRKYMDDNAPDFDLVADINMDMAHSFGINTWSSVSEGSFVYVIDKNNRISYASHNYKGEGEKLRAVQKEISGLLDINLPAPDISGNKKTLFTGDAAPDFSFTYTTLDGNFSSTEESAKLSDYAGKKNVIIAFYPAPYSLSCAMEVKSFDAFAEDQTLKKITESSMGESDVEFLMISNSSLEILAKWKNDMKLKNVKLVSDYSGMISALYNSYNQFGYFNRTLFIVDKSGMLSYIDWNYEVNDTDFNKVKDQLGLISENR